MSDGHDPVRFRDSSRAEEQRLAHLFRSAAGDLPSARELDGLATRLGPVLDAKPATSASPGSFSKLGALGGGAAVLAIVGGYLLARPPARIEPAPSPPQASVARVPSPPTDVSPSPSLAPAPEPPPAPQVDVAPPASTAKASAKPDEASLLEQARRALATNPTQALALTRRHQALYPRGVLVQEREVIAIEALRRLGRGGQAADRANDFEKSFPDSAHRRAVEKGLGQ